MSRTLLLADDSVVIQKLVGLSFANEDVEIITVDNGDDAITRAAETKPDLVLADVVMPGKSGYEVCSAVRQNPELANTPVLLLTGTFEAFDEGRANEVGANGFITKPFEANALVERVNELLAQVAAPAAAAPAAAGNEFFDENLGDLGAPIESGEPLSSHDAGSANDFAFGSSEHEPLAGEHDLASGEMIFPEPSAPGISNDAGLNNLLDNNLLDDAGGDHTVAMIPEPMAPVSSTPIGAMRMGDPVLSPPPIPQAASGDNLIDPVMGRAATPGIDPILMEDDLLGGAGMSDPAETLLATDAFADPGMPDFGDPGASGDPLASPMGQSEPDSFGSTAPIANRPPIASDDLSFGSSARSQDAGPIGTSSNPDETVLATDLFSAPPIAAQAVETEPPMPPPLPSAQPLQSNGLDLDFGSAASRADSKSGAFPDSFDVSASDLDSDFSADLGDDPLMAAPASYLDDAPPAMPGVPAADPFADTEPERSASAAIPASPSAAFADRGPLDATPVEEPIADLEASTRDLISDHTSARSSDRSPDLSPMMRERIHDTLEKVAWEAFSDLSENIARQVLERVEKIAWEVIPQMTETLIQEEIRRMKDGKE
jgi:CheY-like chemotaxis protein